MLGFGGFPYRPSVVPLEEDEEELEVSPTSKLALYLIALWVVPIFSFLLLRWSLVYLVLPYLTLLSVSYLFFKPTGSVEIWRVVHHNRFLEGQEVEIEVHVKTDFRIDYFYVRDLVPDLEVIGKPEKVFSLKPGEEGVLKYKVRMRRGIHRFEGFRVSYRDPFGFFSSDRFVDHFTEIVGVPILYDVQTPYSTKGTKITIGPLPSPLIGGGLEFHAIREYQPGDPLKVINWKATARTGKIMANEFESERKVDVVFVVDGSRLNEPVFDYLIRAAASLMLNALNDGTSFGLLLAERIPLWVRVDYGKRHFFKCIDFLSTARPDNNNFIAYQVEHLVKTSLPPRAQIIYFSPLLTEESRNALKILARYGYNVVVISPNPNSLYEPKTEEEKLAMELVQLKRKAVLKNLAGYGVIIDWDVRKPLKAAIAEVLGK
ncbi:MULTISPECIES: DUF58 domain-containing protein [Thermococcus]|uniref:Putative conserved protein (Some members containing a von Willebrand factor type A (VWA) domain) n=1 Tax=Thermococcus nautili TaxID=195522 RepID=W8PMW4_9EURY|nr:MULTISPECIES: DUF58 domain-containing protein [Thermococcus]AHL23379.1 putative conserved protein (some members containing a von Willebrand factor type A (vWA) domain) [Thermococcus nautili]NJE49592.1 DUF58 domain-containing protein [Thermococcus sp. 9N3]CAI1492625.1 conserved protein of unknown function [Thermococcus nautili]